jgi:hypothetical protein
MRRFLLTFTVFSISAWSQPAQQQPQLPPVVKVEMPPTNSWMHIVELVVPGIIGAGLALFGVWLTNKNHAAENAANRQLALDIERTKDEIAAEAKSRDNRWAFRKDVYINLITATSGLIRVASSLGADMVTLQQLRESHTPNNDPRITAVNDRLASATRLYQIHGETFGTNLHLAPLAFAEDVVPLVVAVKDQIFKPDDYATPEAIIASSKQRAVVLGELLRNLQTAGRKDLWGTSETEAKG